MWPGSKFVPGRLNYRLTSRNRRQQDDEESRATVPFPAPVPSFSLREESSSSDRVARSRKDRSPATADPWTVHEDLTGYPRPRAGKFRVTDLREIPPSQILVGGQSSSRVSPLRPLGSGPRNRAGRDFTEHTPIMSVEIKIPNFLDVNMNISC